MHHSPHPQLMPVLFQTPGDESTQPRSGGADQRDNRLALGEGEGFGRLCHPSSPGSYLATSRSAQPALASSSSGRGAGGCFWPGGRSGGKQCRPRPAGIWPLLSPRERKEPAKRASFPDSALNPRPFLLLSTQGLRQHAPPPPATAAAPGPGKLQRSPRGPHPKFSAGAARASSPPRRKGAAPGRAPWAQKGGDGILAPSRFEMFIAAKLKSLF